MSLAEFEEHIRRPSPAFECSVGVERPGRPTFLARVRNRINPPADSGALAFFDRLAGAVSHAMRSFYSSHDGVVLYEDTNTTRWSGGEFKASGVAFFPIGEWETKTEELRRSLAEADPADGDPTEWQRNGIVFGEIPQSANYFVLGVSGADVGKVFYNSHDGFEEEAIAESFEDFLDQIVSDPADFLNRLGCYTRFSDGRTASQWIPEKYVDLD